MRRLEAAFSFLCVRKFPARQFGHHRCTPGILLPVCQITRGLLNTFVSNPALGIAGFVALVRQPRFGFAMPTRQGSTRLRSVSLRPDCAGAPGSHQISQKMNSANAGTPSNHAMRYLPMMCLLEIGE